jgi:hypothetical protein
MRIAARSVTAWDFIAAGEVSLLKSWPCDRRLFMTCPRIVCRTSRTPLGSKPALYNRQMKHYACRRNKSTGYERRASQGTIGRWSIDHGRSA